MAKGKGPRRIGELLPSTAEKPRGTKKVPLSTDADRNNTGKNNAGKLEGAAALIASAPAELVGQVGYFPPYLVQCTLPHSDPKTARWERTVPWLRLVVFGDPLVPYGPLSRLFLSHVMTRAVVTGSPTIELPDTTGGLAAVLGVDAGDTRTRRRLREQLARCLSATWRAEVLGEVLDPSEGLAAEMAAEGLGGRQVQRRHGHSWSLSTSWEGLAVAGEFDQRSLVTPVIELDPRLWQLLQERAAPHDMRALRALAGSSLAMDLYTWANLKLATLTKPEFFPWTWLMQQFGSDYDPTNADARRKFKVRAITQLQAVSKVWPGVTACVEVVKGSGKQQLGGLKLRPGKPHVRLVK